MRQHARHSSNAHRVTQRSTHAGQHGHYDRQRLLAGHQDHGTSHADRGSRAVRPAELEKTHKRGIGNQEQAMDEQRGGSGQRQVWCGQRRALRNGTAHLRGSEKALMPQRSKHTGCDMGA